MAIKASELRKNLFTLLDRVSRGERVEIDYKGAVLVISAVRPTVSKLSRLKQRDILRVPAETLIHSDAREFESEWENEDRELGS